MLAARHCVESWPRPCGSARTRDGVVVTWRCHWAAARQLVLVQSTEPSHWDTLLVVLYPYPVDGHAVDFG